MSSVSVKMGGDAGHRRPAPRLRRHSARLGSGDRAAGPRTLYRARSGPAWPRRACATSGRSRSPRSTADVLAAAPERFALCGYSMGGRIALHVALAAPERIERLVLVGATAGIEDDAERAARRAERRAPRRVRGRARRWRRSPTAGRPSRCSPARRRRRPGSGARILVRNDPRALAAVLRGVGTGAMAPLWDRLGELTMPVGRARRRARRRSSSRSPAGWPPRCPTPS